MLHSKSRTGIPTTLAETIIYIFFSCLTIVVGTLGYLPALHTNNGSSSFIQRRKFILKD
jgi:hypothetical protein